MNSSHTEAIVKFYKGKLWKAIASYTEAEFNYHIEELKGMSHEGYENLAKIDPSTWCKAWLPIHTKCDLLVNKLCES